MTFAPTIHKALLAGVARSPLGPDAPLQQVATGVPEPLRLWHLVAANDLWQRAGCMPALAQSEAAPPCPTAPACPRGAERVLQMILAGVHVEQLPAWLALARRHGMALPHGLLVPLLELGTQKPALRADLAPVLGVRGHWLVAQHPAWSTQYGAAVDPAAPDAHWQLGTLAQRCAALAAMRRADPATALAALEAEWPNEPPEHRAAFLPMLFQGLGPADEAFLERVLDDKRKEVRVWAQQLLVALPGSQLVERCKARLGALFGAPAPELALTLPDACDKAMKRDGIGNETHRGLGEKAGWLLDLMRCVPPPHWSATWQMTPRAVLAVFARHEFHMALVTGLVHGAARTLGAHPDRDAVDWFVMLAGEDLPGGAGLQSAAVLLRDMQRLPPVDQERIVLRWLEQPGSALRADTPALTWAEQRFGASADPMPPALSQRMLGGAQSAMLVAAQPSYEAQRAFTILSRTLDPAVLATAHTGWPAPDWEHWPQWRDAVDKFTDTLQFRTTMQASFLETDG
jgi:hypothetical protein